MRSAAALILVIVPLPAAAAIPSDVGDDRSRLSIRIHGLAVHPYSQRWLIDYYPLPIDSVAAVVVTPGIAVAWDHRLPYPAATHVRAMLNLNLDCAFQPSAIAAFGVLFHRWGSDIFSLQLGLGLAGYVRRNWNRYVAVFNWRFTYMVASGEVEWIVLPYPEVEFRLHPPGRNIEFVLNIVPGGVINLVNVGVRFALGSVSSLAGNDANGQH